MKFKFRNEDFEVFIFSVTINTDFTLHFIPGPQACAKIVQNKLPQYKFNRLLNSKMWYYHNLLTCTGQRQNKSSWACWWRLTRELTSLNSQRLSLMLLSVVLSSTPRNKEMPVSRRCVITPTDHKSAGKLTPSPLATSGDTNSGIPATSYWVRLYNIGGVEWGLKDKEHSKTITASSNIKTH